MLEIVPFSDEHLDGVLALCEAEGWTSLNEDPDRAARVLRAPGSLALVAVDEGAVAGFAHVLSDGELHGYLCRLVVAEAARRRGVARALVETAFARSGALRLDLLAAEGSERFYESFPHRGWPGYRIYPG
ncbi:MAG TPA: GNAT family N-acetyltransferase [Gaiellaceae bacterium]|nr:GNAT family N-acetyltransferase [Gaiellaceae bacterium]